MGLYTSRGFTPGEIRGFLVETFLNDSTDPSPSSSRLSLSLSRACASLLAHFPGPNLPPLIAGAHRRIIASARGEPTGYAT